MENICHATPSTFAHESTIAYTLLTNNARLLLTLMPPSPVIKVTTADNDDSRTHTLGRESTDAIHHYNDQKVREKEIA